MNLHRVRTYIILSSFIALIAGCQSAVRFASDGGNKSSVTRSGNSGNENEIIEFGRLSDDSDLTDIEKELLKEAESWIGVPYRYGGDDRSGIDCSAFVMSVFSAISVHLPRTSRQQYAGTKRVSSDELQFGDLVFFKNGSTISHVGLYIGNGWMIHASSSMGVTKQKLDDYYYKKNYAGAGRIHFE